MLDLKQRSKILATSADINGVLIIEPAVYRDDRGWFTESFNAHDFLNITGTSPSFVQDNHSFSKKAILRGLHYQLEKPQGKLIRVTRGSIFDVVVDLRRDSGTFGHWMGTELSSQNRKQLWIPPGLAHGFLVVSDIAEVLYKTTDYYHPKSEVCLAWDDPIVNIEWPLSAGVTPILNAKDSVGLSWEQAPKF